jgi:hypothetical protein
MTRVSRFFRYMQITIAAVSGDARGDGPCRNLP